MSQLNRPDAQISYEISGHGPPVLLIQGVGAAGEAWRLQTDGLQKDFQTLIFDNRGVRHSAPCAGPISIEKMAEDALALMDVAGWASAHVVGHSMGGLIAQQLALDAPKRVRSLSLLCSFSKGPEAARLTPWVLWMTLRTRLGPRRARRRAFLEMLYPQKYLQTVDLDKCAAETGRLVGRDLADSPPILLKQVRAMARHDVSARLPELGGIPSLVVSAAQDPIALPRFGKALAAAIPRARYVEIPNASHGVILNQADQINSLLASFFTEAETIRSATAV